MKRLGLKVATLLVAGWLAIPSITFAQPAQKPVVQVVLFYSPTCSHCHYVITEVLVPLVNEYGDQLQILAIDSTQPNGAALYHATVKRYEIPLERQGVPTLIIGDMVLVGSGEIPAQFPALVEEQLAAGGVGWPDIPELKQIISAETTPEPSPSVTPQATVSPSLTPTLPATSMAAVTSAETLPVYLAYFFDPTCLICKRVSADLAYLQEQYPHLVVRQFDVGQEVALNEAMCEKYNVPDAYHLMAPTIFIGQDCLLPGEITLERLQTLIENQDSSSAPPPWKDLETRETTAANRIVERFKQFSPLAVAGAGLLDGLNPCAFTTMTFFVSYLTLMGRTGKEILLVGAAFTLAVFLSYLAMGLGLLEIVRQIGSFPLIGQVVYGIIALICLALAGLSIWDYLKIKQGRLKEISLQLPKAFKQRIHQTIRTRSRMKGYMGAAFGVGVLISVFELACTGQVYLPTIVFVTGVAELRLTAIAYLILYNLMFVIPLIVIFMVAYWGISSRQLTAIFQKQAGMVKLLTAILLGVLGVWLGYIVLKGF
jgi:protein-disulfide isomerase